MPAQAPMDAALAASEEERFRVAFDAAPIGMVLVDADRRFLQVNDAFCEFLGYSRDELLARTFSDVTVPEDVAREETEFRQLWAGEIRSYELEKRFVRKDGELRWALIRRTMIRGSDGMPHYAITQVVDISDRVRRNDEAEFIVETGQLLSASLDHNEVVRVLARLAVPRLADWCVVDLVGGNGVRTVEIVAATPRKEELLRAVRARYPLSVDQMPGPIREAMRTGKALLLPSVEPALLERTAQDAEHLALLRELHAISSMVVPLVARGRVMGAVSFAIADSGRHYDVRDLRLAEELASTAALAVDNALLYRQAVAATKLRDDVVAFIAHDLRNPISSAAMAAETLKDAGLTLEQRRRTAATILDATAMMSGLVSDLVDVAAIEAGRLRIEQEPVRAAALLHATAELFEPQARAKRVALEVDAEDLPYVFADAQRVQQVMANLVGNALRFTPDGGTITLRGRRVTDRVVFSVSDTGPGITPEQMPHLFDRFWQGAESRRGGAGLGLAIAKGIVEAHGGEIWAESTPGHGATFSFSLLVWRGSLAKMASTPPKPREAQAAAPAARVLVVDDQPVARIGVTELLARHSGFEVVGQAASGEEAVDLARTTKPDVVIMDLAMPGIGGIEATRRIMAMNPDAKIVALTGSAMDEALSDALQAGARGFLQKSASPETLISAVQSVARGELLLDKSAAPLLQAQAKRAAPAPRDPLAALTTQERGVLALTAQGYSAAQAAQKLSLSPKTVETYRSRAMKKLGLGSRADLIAFAIQTRLLST